MKKVFCVYIMTNGHNTVLYTGMTSNLKGRVWQHKNHVVEGFTKRYKTTKLVYYEACGSAEGAILREKRINAMRRIEKEKLLWDINPTWRDLYDDI